MSAIDEEMKKPRWVCYKLVKKGNGLNKIPYSPFTNTPTSVMDPNNLSTYEFCVQKSKEFGLNGVGIVLNGDGLCCVDLDGCFKEGNINPKALDVISKLDSYTEKSVSKNGAHIFIYCDKKFKKTRSSKTEIPIEIYTEKRFIAFTHDMYHNVDILNRTQELNAIFNHFFVKETFLDRIKKNKHDYEKYLRLKSGDMSEYNYDHSAADLGLMNILAKYSYTIEECDTLFRQTELCREKYLNRLDYREGLFEKVEKKLIKNQQKAEKEEEKNFVLNDKAMCMLLRDKYDIFLYNVNEKSYYIYNGKYYEPDIKNKFTFHLSEVIDSLTYSPDWSNSLITKIKKTYQGNKGSKNVKEFYPIFPGVSITSDKFNPDKHLICCRNGILNLRNGDLLDFDKKYMINHYIDINYNKNAKYEGSKFQSLINRTFENNKEIIDYVQVLVGYFLTGETSEQSFYYFKGKASTGKSLFINLIKLVAGTYVDTISPNCLHEGSSESLKAMAYVASKRLVLILEENSNSKLDTSLIKAITGGDSIEARDLYARQFSYKPQFKLLTGSNEIPEMDSEDTSMIRRLKVIPFNNVVKGDEVNPHLFEELIEEAEIIFNWAIEGAIKYYKQGFPKVSFIDKEVTEVFDDQDKLFEWIEECCEKDVNSFHSTKELLTSYLNFCNRNNILPDFRTPRPFSIYLNQKSYVIKTQKGEHNHRGYMGLKLKI